MNRLLRRVAAAALAAATLTVGLGVGVAQAHAAVPLRDVDDFSFSRLDIDLTLGLAEDGSSTLRVVETFVAEFPQIDQNRGMRRALPTVYNGQPLHPSAVSITDADGRARAMEVETDDGEFVMTSRADAYVHGGQTYVFTYTLENVTWRFADTDADEFYWDVVGEGWAQPFGAVEVTLRADEAVRAAATGAMACYSGSPGATDRCAVQPGDGDVLATARVTDLAPHQNLTLAVAFRNGTFTLFDASPLASPWGWLQLVAFLLVLGALAWAIVVRTTRLRDEPGRATIIAEYSPPPGLDALLSAVLLGTTTKAISAEILEQAVVGSIRIVEGRAKAFGGVAVTAELVDRSRADDDGRMLLDALFGENASPGASDEFGKTDSRFSTRSQALVKWAHAELRDRGLRRPVPRGARVWPVVAAGGAGALTVAAGIAALQASVMPWWPIALLAGAGIAFFIVLGLVAHRPLSAKGSEARDHLRGLRTFIAWAEADRIRMLQSPSGAERVPIDTGDPRQMLRLYERLLPYAVLFGQERQWAERLAVLYGDSGSPGWYVGSHGFSAAVFSAGIGSLSSSASSSSGGSSGGGSAGGGGGGGGGGGV